MFWGREAELATLDRHLREVIASDRGRLLAVRGRRQAGKSRLVTESVARAEVPSLFATAARFDTPDNHRAGFVRAASDAQRQLPKHALALRPGGHSSWTDLFDALVLATDGEPAIVVLDEYPWAREADPALDGALQVAWDRQLEDLPVLLVLVGSDISVMAALGSYAQPPKLGGSSAPAGKVDEGRGETGRAKARCGRVREMVVGPLGVGDVAGALDGWEDVQSIDAGLVTGGFPRLVAAASSHTDARAFVEASLVDEHSELAVVGQRMLDVEFAEDLPARQVLTAIGSVEVGHPTFSAAVAKLGGDGAARTAVARALEVLQAKQVLAIDTPSGSKPNTRTRRYRITDPALRFWLRFVGPRLEDIARARPDLALEAFRRGYEAWRCRAVEPLVRDAVNRLAATDDGVLAGTARVDAWWDRTGRVEVDLVGRRLDGSVSFVGTTKWRETKPVTASEVRHLAAARDSVPGATDAPLVVVCPASATPEANADLVLTAAEILSAYN